LFSNFRKYLSISQLEIYNFIKDNYTGEVLSDVKNIINPYEIDIYIPDLNLGFEFNGIWWTLINIRKTTII
jgi:hypothetical protein